MFALLLHLLAVGSASDGPGELQLRQPAGAASSAAAAAAGGYHRGRRTIHYEVGATYSFDFELFVRSDGLGAGIAAARQHERMDARCDVTALQHSDTSWLLELEVSEMHQSQIHEDGSAHAVPSMGDDRLGRHAFYVLQERDGAITSVFYPAHEALDVANVKKGTTHTPAPRRSSLFSRAGSR